MKTFRFLCCCLFFQLTVRQVHVKGVIEIIKNCFLLWYTARGAKIVERFHARNSPRTISITHHICIVVWWRLLLVVLIEVGASNTEKPGTEETAHFLQFSCSHVVTLKQKCRLTCWFLVLTVSMTDSQPTNKRIDWQTRSLIQWQNDCLTCWLTN